LNRYFIEISFDGTLYHGYQFQPGVSSAQEELEKALSTLFQEKINIIGASRTDTGVHIKQTYAHFETDKVVPHLFERRINFMLPTDICIKKLHPVNGKAHARFDAIQRSYEYLINYTKNPFLINRSYYFPYQPLNIELLNEACRFLQTQSDFEPYCKRNSNNKTTLCRIDEIGWNYDQNENILKFNIKADRFLRGMIRGLVGTMIKVGNGKYSMDYFKEISIKKIKSRVDFSAPGCGLYLTTVKYPDNYFEHENIDVAP
jgi:tRNA pseudouridine38-40 synthase